MKRPRGFTLVEALISVLILSVVMIVALTLLVSMRSFAAKQQTFTAPRQAARSAVDYLSYFLAGATDLNVEAGNPNALVIWYSAGNASKANLRQASYNNLTAAQAAAGFGDVGTDIITMSVPTNPVRIPIVQWPGNDVAGKTMDVNFTAGCPDDTKNMAMFMQATGATLVGSQYESGILTVQDGQGRWRYMQITNYNWSKCSEAGVSDQVIHLEITPGGSDQLNPPGGWKLNPAPVPPFTINGGIDFTSFRVRNRNLEQKTTSFDSAGTLAPGIFNPDCDVLTPTSGCPTNSFTPVVENVEDFQVAYIFLDGGVWNTATRTLGTSQSVPEQAATVSATPGQYDVVNVRALRLSVVARSNPLDIGARNISASLATGHFHTFALEDHNVATADTLANGVFDRFRLTTTVLLRNRMLGY